jgi:archaeosine-15-forming tRNA-guanine transglycosylase
MNTVKKVSYLREQGVNVVEMWECDLKRELEENEEMRRHFQEHELIDPLEPRDAFFGGRTNAAKLLHECKGQEKIRLVLL